MDICLLLFYTGYFVMVVYTKDVIYYIILYSQTITMIFTHLQL